MSHPFEQNLRQEGEIVMICGKCGADNDGSYKYCRVCGEPLMEDIVSDSHYEQPPGAEPGTTKRYRGYSLETTKRYHRKNGQSFERLRREPDETDEPLTDISREEARAPQPRTSQHRSYASPIQAVERDRRAAVCDYNDHFENNKYEKTQHIPTYTQPRARRGALGIPYLVVTYFTAFVSLLNFVMPFLDWVHFRFSVPMLGITLDEKYTPFRIVEELFGISDVSSQLNDAVQSFSGWDIFPDFIGADAESLNAALFFAKIVSTVIFSVFAIGLILYFVFFVLALLQRKSATGFGITAAVFMLLSGGGFVLGASYLSSQTGGMISVLNAPYQLIALSVVLIALIAVMAILRVLSHRRY